MARWYGQAWGRVKAWLEKHPRFHLQFTPTSSSWPILIERWFRELTDKRIRRGSFPSVPELIAAIEEFIAANHDNPKPFIWTASVEKILKKISHCKAILGTVHSIGVRYECQALNPSVSPDFR